MTFPFSKCDRKICSSSAIATDEKGSQYFVVDASIWSSAKCRENCDEAEEKEQRFEISAVGTVSKTSCCRFCIFFFATSRS